MRVSFQRKLYLKLCAAPGNPCSNLLSPNRHTAVAQLVQRARHPAVTSAVKRAAMMAMTSGPDFHNKGGERPRERDFTAEVVYYSV